ncbi:MAG: methionyl-tRNA formyltransferase [Verrucomicrobia bacterium]|nr:methionyl-tRNA formyltransferase [Verrucomicrobiota bacterium]
MGEQPNLNPTIQNPNEPTLRPSSTGAQSPLRVVFFGTGQLARPSLVALAASRFIELAAVVTQPDRPKGRDLKLQPSPVKTEALRLAANILQPERARDPSFLQTLAELKTALIAVAAYGQILPPSILSLPTFGCLNVHASLLPKYRGAAPIQWAILNDESETGVTIMKMDAGLDTGDILAQEKTPISPSDDAQSVHDRLARMGATLLLRTIPDYVGGNIIARKQPADGATYARKISKEDGKLDWSAPARALWNRIRALTPWPGAFTLWSREGSDRLLKIWQAEVVVESGGAPGTVRRADRAGLIVACGEHALRIFSLQLEGGRRLTAQEFLSGHSLAPGEQFGIYARSAQTEHQDQE